MQPGYFSDRKAAGRALAAALGNYEGGDDVLVLALPRGGVPVAYEVATALEAPLDIFVVRKLGVPGHEEYAMGAIASGGVRVLNEEIVFSLGISERAVAEVAEKEGRELARREQAYRGERPAPAIRDKTVILVDDGLATGATMQAAVRAVHLQQPKRLVVAVPVAPPDVCAQLRRQVDEVVSVITPEPFYAVGLWYKSFPQTSDEEVRELLAAAPRVDTAAASRAGRTQP